MKKPPHGISFPVVVRNVHDGDTVKLSRVGSDLEFPVRLLDNWAPETTIRGNASEFSEAKKARILAAGERAKEALQGLIDNAKSFTVLIPFDQIRDKNVFDLFTMGRILGYLFADDVDVSEYLVQHGLSFRTKEALQEAGLG